MTTLGYAKDYYYGSDSTLNIRVRIPSIHGPYKQSDAKGQTIRNYVRDEDLPYYQSVILPQYPKDGDVVLIMDNYVVGLLGSSYSSGKEL